MSFVKSFFSVLVESFTPFRRTDWERRRLLAVFRSLVFWISSLEISFGWFMWRTMVIGFFEDLIMLSFCGVRRFGAATGRRVWIRIVLMCGMRPRVVMISLSFFGWSVNGSPPERITSQISLCCFMYLKAFVRSGFCFCCVSFWPVRRFFLKQNLQCMAQVVVGISRTLSGYLWMRPGAFSWRRSAIGSVNSCGFVTSSLREKTAIL